MFGKTCDILICAALLVLAVVVEFLLWQFGGISGLNFFGLVGASIFLASLRATYVAYSQNTSQEEDEEATDPDMLNDDGRGAKPKVADQGLATGDAPNAHNTTTWYDR